MNLILILTNPDILPDGLRAHQIEFSESGGMIGRNQSCDWVLEDPDRYVSSRHVKVSCKNDVFFVEDISTNGTLLNDDLIGKGNRRPVITGDVLRVGRFNITVEQRDANGQLVGESSGPDLLEDIPSEAIEVLAPSSLDDKVEGDLLSELADEQSTDLLVDTSHSHAVHDAIDTPMKTPSLLGEDDIIPENWMDAGKGAADEENSLKSEAASFELEEADFDLTPVQASIVSDNADTLEASTSIVEEGAFPSVTAGNAVQPTIQESKNFDAELETNSDPRRPLIPTAPLPDGSDAFSIGFLQATQLPSEKATFETGQILGSVMRELLDGTLNGLDARAKMQEELRLNGLTVGSRENNPLKFSINSQDAIARLLQGEATGFKAPIPATREAMNDLSAHQLGVLSGIKAGVRALLEALTPREVAGSKPPMTGAGMLKKLTDHHSDIMEQTVDRRDGIFWRAFTKAYKVASANAQRR